MDGCFRKPCLFNFPEFQSDDVNQKHFENKFCPTELGMIYAVKILSFMAIEFFVFKVEDFQFSKFHKNVIKLDKGNFKKGLTVTLKVKNS